MTGWFARLPIHRKLTVMAVAVSGAALTVALIGLLAFDVARFRRSAIDDANATAEVIAQNAAAVIVFDDVQGAREMLAGLRVRPLIACACAYRNDGSLLAGFERSNSCPVVPVTKRGWRAVAAAVPVVRNERVVGTVYVERQLNDLPRRVLFTAAAGAATLAIAVALAFGLARILQRAISRPIVALASAARDIEHGAQFAVPPIDAPPDETGQLVEAFSAMVARMVAVNDALRSENEERRRMQAERESLLQREREASRLKDEFLAAVSHELRTPLNAILGWTQVLRDTKPSPETIDAALASLSRNAQAQSRVVQDLLDVSRIVTGKLKLNMVTTDLRDIAESALETVAPQAHTKRISVRTEMSRQRCLLCGDVDRVRQILWNLLSNAIKFTPAGGSVELIVSQDATTVRATVRDSGIGIDAAFLPFIFERFRQADGSTTREQSGLGLGLAIVKELAEAHGGSVSVASEGSGRGSTFTVVFPRLADTAERRELDVVVAPSRLDNVDVLVLDDNPDALQILTAALANAGARVRVASRAQQALAEIERAVPDIVLCDLAMPGVDGFGFLSQVRAMENADARSLPIIAVTAYTSPSDRERSLRAGFVDHVGKPYDVADLTRRIALALSESRIARSKLDT